MRLDPPAAVLKRLAHRPSWRPLFPAILLFALFLAVSIAGLDWGRTYWDQHRSQLAAGTIILVTGAATVTFPILFGPLRLFRPRRSHWLIFAAVVIAACLLVSFVALDGQLHSADEYAYLFEARTLASGHLWNTPPRLGVAESPLYVWVVKGKWVAQYPPGWPAVLALLSLFSPTERLANALVILVTALGIAALVRPRAGRRAAWIAAMIFGLSPFAIFNGASFYSHPLAAALAVAAMLASREARLRRSLPYALLTGAVVGLLGITRSVTAVVLIAAVLADQVRTPGWFFRLVAIGVGGAPFVAALLGYQYSITGNPLEPVYWYSGRNVDHLYFDLPSIKLGAYHGVQSLGELSLYAAPFILFLWATAMLLLLRRRRLEAMDFVFPLGLFIFLFYPLHPGSRYGPRYYFDFWPLMVVTIAAVIPVVPLVWRQWYRQVLLFSIVYCVVATVALGLEWGRMTRNRFDVYRVVAASGLHDALVCMITPSGTLLTAGNGGIARNGLRPDDNPVIFVNCDETSVSAMRAAYPRRTIWGYYRDPGKTTGYLAVIARP